MTKFDTERKGTTAVIRSSSSGEYETFEEACLAIDGVAEGSLYPLTPDIIIVIDDIEFVLPDGLNKIQAGASLEDLIPSEEIEIRKKNEVENIFEAKSTGNWDDVPDHVFDEQASDVILTTSMFVANHEILQELDVITAQCAYGMNVFRDIFVAVRDIVGGRAKSVEKILLDARIVVMSELRREALKLGGDAVIAIQFDVSELAGGQKSGVMLIMAIGTAVRLKEI